MSAQCSNCPHNFEEDFGLVTCPDCGLTGFIDLDGEFSSQDSLQEETTSESDIELESSEDPSTFAEPLPEALDEVQNDLNFESNEEAQDGEEDLLSASDLESESINQDTEDETPEESQWAEPLEPQDEIAEFDVEDTESFENLTHQEEDSKEVLHSNPQEENPETKLNDKDEASEFIKNIEEFSELESGLLNSGEPIYELLVGEIKDNDISDIAIELSDSRLKIGSEPEIQDMIQNGNLKLKALNRVQLAISVRRLSAFKCQLDWKQIEIHEDEFVESIDTPPESDSGLSEELDDLI